MNPCQAVGIAVVAVGVEKNSDDLVVQVIGCESENQSPVVVKRVLARGVDFLVEASGALRACFLAYCAAGIDLDLGGSDSFGLGVVVTAGILDCVGVDDAGAGAAAAAHILVLDADLAEDGDIAAVAVAAMVGPGTAEVAPFHLVCLEKDFGAGT